MKQVTLSSFICILIISCIQFGCKNSANTDGTTNSTTKVASTKRAKLVDVDEMIRLHRQEKYYLLDVRTPSEISNGKILNAMEIDYRASDFVSKVGALDKTRGIVVYCQSGGRSKKASDKMIELGFSNVADLMGGFSAWEFAQQKKSNE